MIKIFQIFLILLFFPAIVFSQNLIITEVQVRGETPDESYIKIYNPSYNKIDISGFRLVKKSSTGREYSLRVFPKESFILPESYFVWANSRNDYYKEINADVYSTASISSNNSIALLSDKRTLIDSLSWGEGENQFQMGNPLTTNPEKNQLIKRVKKDTYQNTQNNKKDFYIYPEKDIIELDYKKSLENLKKKEFFPFKEGFAVAFFSSLITLLLKKNLEEKIDYYGRS